VWIDGASANTMALLTYMAASTTDAGGGSWTYYTGELYLADFYFEFLGP
jgi:hypothetical protein